jgi:hypothetical protein
MFGNHITSPLEFWKTVRDNEITVKGIAENLHKATKAKAKIIIDWILDKRSDWYIRELFEKDPGKIRALLFNHCVRLGYHREVELLLPVQHNDVAMVEILLRDDRVDPTAVNFDALRIAVDERNPIILSMLIWNQNTIDSFDEDTVRRWRNDVPYDSPIFKILTEFINRAHRSTLKDAEREHKRVAANIVF